MSNSENVAKRLGLESTESGYELNKKSLLDSIGGPLGIAEAVLPATLFSFAYALSKDALTAVVIAASSSLVFILVRILQRKALTQAVVGALAIALAAFLALRDGGQAADYFVPGFITNAVYGTVLLTSVLLRRPIMGYVAQLLFSLDGWREHKPSYRRLRLVTLIWVGFFTTRLAVQLPLYFAGAVEALALARAVMGAPAYAGLLALTWVLLRRIKAS
jgi:intracellular septation protein A